MNKNLIQENISQIKFSKEKKNLKWENIPQIKAL